jgi:predicted nucleic acid-binding protein
VIVVDSSAIIGGLLDEGMARELLVGGDVHVPHLADAEVAQGLRHLTRRGTLAADAAAAGLARWSRLGVRRHPGRGLLPRIWALRENLSAYDATYVALAESLGCPLATADRRLIGAPGPRCDVLEVRS